MNLFQSNILMQLIDKLTNWQQIHIVHVSILYDMPRMFVMDWILKKYHGIRSYCLVYKFEGNNNRVCQDRE